MMWLGVCCFKQKTAYEVRISDWSSDVCSSDLWPDCRGIAARSAAGGSREGGRPDTPPAWPRRTGVAVVRGSGRRVLPCLVASCHPLDQRPGQIGRESCRESVLQYV